MIAKELIKLLSKYPEHEVELYDSFDSAEYPIDDVFIDEEGIFLSVNVCGCSDEVEYEEDSVEEYLEQGFNLVDIDPNDPVGIENFK